MPFTMIVFVEKRCLHFENLNVYLMSLTNFVTLNGLKYFLSHKVSIDRLTICYMQTEMLALEDE